MKYKNKNKGFTLVELVVSIAILSLLAVTFLPIFRTSSGMIFYAGNKTEAIFRAQMEMENLIADKTIRITPPIQNTNNMTITDTVSEAAINIVSSDGTLTIQGRQLQSEVLYNTANKKAVLNAFIPDN